MVDLPEPIFPSKLRITGTGDDDDDDEDTGIMRQSAGGGLWVIYNTRVYLIQFTPAVWIIMLILLPPPPPSLRTYIPAVFEMIKGWKIDIKEAR